MIRVGLVGLGDAGRHHARALAALQAAGRLAWTAIAAPDEARVARFRGENAVPPHVAAFGSLDALLASRACDAVILAVPDGLHAQQVAACAARDHHVLVEKPLALTIDDGAQAAAACRSAGVVLAVGYHLRHHPAHRVAYARREDLVGALRHVSVRWAWPDPATGGWRARGEGARFWSLAALGTHAIDLALWLTGAKVARVAAVLEPPTGIDRAAEMSLAFEEGTLAHVSVAVTHRAAPRLVIAGERGEIECTGTLGARGDGELAHRPAREAPRPLAFVPEDPYAAQLAAFVARVEERRHDERGVADAVENLAVLERAASSGRPS